MQKEQPKISVITVCLNAADVINATIASVGRQTYSNLEYIVIDGGSADGTVEILQSFSEKGKLKYISEPDSGIYDAMNKGVKLATGQWIFFLGSDDVFFNDAVLERIFSRVYENEEIIYGNVKFLHSGAIYDGPFDFEKISVKNICQQSVFYKKSVFEKIGLFNLRYKIYADHEFNIRWMGAKTASLYLDETVVVYNEKGISGKVIDDVFNKEMDELLIKNNIVSSRSFTALKKINEQLLSSRKYKIGQLVVTPVAWLKRKLAPLL